MGGNFNLTNREQQVVKLISQGRDRKCIADELNISIHTVDSHMRHIHMKTGTRSLSEVIVWYMSKNQNNLQEK